MYLDLLRWSLLALEGWKCVALLSENFALSLRALQLALRYVLQLVALIALDGRE